MKEVGPPSKDVSATSGESGEFELNIGLCKVSEAIMENMIVDLSGVIRAVISFNTLPFHGRQQVNLFLDKSRFML